MAQPALNFINEQEFLTFERSSEEKHEYYKGEVFAMSGASFKHNVIENNIRISLGFFLKNKNCSSFGSNLRIHIPSNTLYTYPDILIICDEPVFVDNEFDTIINPSVIIEILSSSTANYDRGAKFDLYREIESLQEYILIDSINIHIINYNRNHDNTWTLSETKNMDDLFVIHTVNFSISLSEIYAGIKMI